MGIFHARGFLFAGVLLGEKIFQVELTNEEISVKTISIFYIAQNLQIFVKQSPNYLKLGENTGCIF